MSNLAGIVIGLSLAGGTAVGAVLHFSLNDLMELEAKEKVKCYSLGYLIIYQLNSYWLFSLVFILFTILTNKIIAPITIIKARKVAQPDETKLRDNIPRPTTPTATVNSNIIIASETNATTVTNISSKKLMDSILRSKNNLLNFIFNYSICQI